MFKVTTSTPQMSKNRGGKSKVNPSTKPNNQATDRHSGTPTLRQAKQSTKQPTNRVVIAFSGQPKGRLAGWQAMQTVSVSQLVVSWLANNSLWLVDVWLMAACVCMCVCVRVFVWYLQLKLKLR